MISCRSTAEGPSDEIGEPSLSRDRAGPAVSFGDDAVRYHARVIADCGPLQEGYDCSRQRE